MLVSKIPLKQFRNMNKFLKCYREDAHDLKVTLPSCGPYKSIFNVESNHDDLEITDQLPWYDHYQSPYTLY